MPSVDALCIRHRRNRSLQIKLNLITVTWYKSSLHSLTVLQKRAVRFIAGAPYGSHTSQIFSEFGLLRIEQIRVAQIGEFVYRYDHDLLPPVYKGFFVILLIYILTILEVRIPIVVTMLAEILVYSPLKVLVL